MMNYEDIEKLRSELLDTKKKLADYAMMHNMLNRISSIESESDVIKGIYEVFTILCAPAQLIYFPVVQGAFDQKEYLDKNFLHQEQEIQELINSDIDYVWADSQKGFFLKIKHINEPIGIIKIHEFTFPEYRHHYLNLALSITQVLGLAIDNSRKYNKLKQAKEEINKARKAADTANQAKSDFLANMSHELRTPLNGILGYAQILKMDGCLTSPQKSGIDVIERSGKHLLNLINEILDLSKIEARKMEINSSDFYLSVFLNSVVNMIKVHAEKKNIEFHADIAQDIPQTVRGDEKRLGQVLLNLLSNAVKFTHKGEVAFHVFKSGSRIFFKVSDSGIGIAQDDLENIFLPFKQVGRHARTIEGTGLGLSISRKLVRLMGGELNVQSEQDKGSVFSFDLELPEVSDPDEMRIIENRSITGFKGKKKKILVIDDLLENRSVLMGLLLPLGFEVVEAVNGRDGLDLAYEFMPDLVLIDLVMPVMDGFEAVRLMRKSNQLKNVKIIAVSASTSLSHQEIISKSNFDDFIRKPVDFDEVFKALETCLELEWIYGENICREPDCISDNLKLVLPGRSDLESIYQYTRNGDIMKIRQKIDEIQAKDVQYALFAKEMGKLALSFQIKEIREKIKGYLDTDHE
ncbi:ATP-binding protein [Desulfonema limicola]|nr:ATP-binding protein [Desulfonema limicola]